MMRGRPAVYATFASYDEVAHHSGLRARRHAGGAAQARPAVRPHRARAPLRAPAVRDRRPLRPRADAGRDLQAAQRLRARRPRRAVARRAARSTSFTGGDEQNAMVGHAVNEATGRKPSKRAKNDVSDRDVVVLGSGNLGLIYLMEEQRRLTLEEIEERHPRLIPALREHPHVGWLLVRSAEHGAVALGARRHPLPRRGPDRGRGSARRLLADAPAPPAAHRRLRARRRHHGRQLLRPGAGRGLRVRGADLLPRRPRRPADAPVHPAPRAPAACPTEPIVGAAAVHEVLTGWRQMLQGADAQVDAPPAPIAR